jgi:hypothetical protein
MNCTGCPQETKHVYLYVRRDTGLGDFDQDDIDLLNQPIKQESQCNMSGRYSLDKAECIIECCRPELLTPEDIAHYNFDEAKIYTASEARQHISNDLAKWEIVE